jgi:NTP pyrophosphatase (non-canonical NTP hydrolase)
MTINDYQKAALRTEKGSRTDEYPRLLNGLMGLCGEAGEALDELKKHLFQDHWLDKEHIAKELGDVAWYLAVSADALGYDLETIFQMNVDKLRARYPDGFEAERSINRKEGDV